MADEKRLGGFESRDRSLARNCGKVIKELRHSLAAFQIVEQGLERNARTAEDWCASENIGVLHDDLVNQLHGPYLTSKHAKIVTSL